MSIIKIPYQFKNGIPVDNGCCEDFLIINNDNYEFCTDKFFAFRPISSIPNANGTISNTFEYNGDTYTDSILTPTQLITLLATIFECPAEYGCNGQVASFDWCLQPVTCSKWTSTTIVNDITDPQPNLDYTITTITVNGINYGVLPHSVWVDGSAGNASVLVEDYINEIIDYIAGLGIPEYVGARNLASNGFTDNFRGVDLLELYFDLGTTVTINFASTLPSTGTMIEVDETVVQLILEITNTSTLTTGDVLTLFTTSVTDGVQSLSSQSETGIMIVYNIFNSQSLNVNNNWIVNGTIATELQCARNNMATGIITVDEINEAIRGLNDSGMGHLTCGNSIA